MKRGSIRGAVIAVAGIAACGFSPKLGGDGGADSHAVDAGPCQQLASECANDSTLRTCTTLGAPPIDTTCAWGCLGTPGAHCGALVPSGSGATPDDVVNSTGLSDVTIDADINGDDGTIKNSERDPGTGVNHGIEYKLVNGQAVFRAKSWHITANMNLAGALPIVLVAIDDITIDALLDARGKCNGSSAGPGGFAGGDLNAAGSGGGLTGGADGSKGGGGGGHGTAGGDGGNDAATGGLAFGDLTLAILVGGGGGGGGGGAATVVGGGGGGAVQMVAGGTITVSANGNIDASGCGGTHGGNNDSGGGGGAGGAILLEGMTIAISGNVAVNGGGGGAGGGGTSGSRGSHNRTPAAGGPGGDAAGGSGAAGGIAAMAGVMASHSGGGGGGVGIIRLDTRTGTATVDSQTLLSPNFSDPQSTTSQGSAHVQ